MRDIYQPKAELQPIAEESIVPAEAPARRFRGPTYYEPPPQEAPARRFRGPTYYDPQQAKIDATVQRLRQEQLDPGHWKNRILRNIPWHGDAFGLRGLKLLGQPLNVGNLARNIDGEPALDYDASVFPADFIPGVKEVVDTINNFAEGRGFHQAPRRSDGNGFIIPPPSAPPP